LDKPSEANKQLDLADKWWTISDKEHGLAQNQIRMHAVIWYNAALPNLTGVSKAKTQMRIDAFQRASAATFPVAGKWLRREYTDPFLSIKSDGTDIQILKDKAEFTAGEKGNAPLKFIERKPIWVAKQLWAIPDVFMIHPLTPDKPASVDFSKVTKGKKGTLVFNLRRWPHAVNTHVTIKRGGESVADFTFDSDAWRKIEVPFEGDPVIVEVRQVKEWMNLMTFISYQVR
jgi:hypothetical protein